MSPRTPQPKLKGARLRLIYGAFRLARRLGLGDKPERHLARPASVRKGLRAAGWTTLPPPPDVKKDDVTITGRSGPVALRKYLPATLDPKSPRLLFLHGGGWIHGGLDTLDYLCAAVSRQAGCLVVSVEYRLAPETPFPGALEDCDDALDWAASDPSLGPLPAAGLVVMGESAGGNLAAALCVLRARRGHSPIRHQILLYPALDATCSSESMMTIDLPGLERENLLSLLDIYRGTTEPKNPLLSPLFAENPAALPPALVITADIDPLRDDGARYARKLAGAGVKARHVNYEGMPHGFFFMPAIASSAGDGIDEIARELRSLVKA